MKEKKIPQAVVCVAFYGDDIFFMVRQNYLQAFPGYTSFPGGKVDKEEDHQSALFREVKEELDFDLKMAQEKTILKSISLLGVATTPDFNPHRFETFFYAVSFDTQRPRPLFVPQKEEIRESKWAKASQLLSEYEEGRCVFVPPVLILLRSLVMYPNQNKFNLEFIYDHENEVPMIESQSEIYQLMPLSKTLPPAKRTNCFIVGDTIIDPSPSGEAEFLKLLQTITGPQNSFQIKQIFLTHHHHDHYENVVELAQKLNVPILLSSDTHQRILSDQGPTFFKNQIIKIINDDAILTYWKNEPVHVMAVPGHDEGQLAPYVLSKKWMIVGDLFQGVGSVVIKAPEGDMKKYFHTLEKVIAFAPLFIYPSHGIVCGGINRLAEVLEHRKMREREIIEALKEGLDIKAMVKKMYPHLPSELHFLAQMNVESHLAKIRSND